MIGRNAVATETEAGTTYAPGKEDTYLQDPARLDNVSIGQDGSVTYTDENPESKTYQQRVTAGYLSLATFANESGLERLGGSLWGETANSGAPIVGTPATPGFGSTIGGELEMSNVDLATEMTNMITAERGYQANSRVITDGRPNAADAGADGTSPIVLARARGESRTRAPRKEATQRRDTPRSPGRDGAQSRRPVPWLKSVAERRAQMITLNRLGHSDEPFQLNPDMIVTVESTPDTVIALATGAKVVVAETPEEVAAAVHAYRAARARGDAFRRRSAAARSRRLLRPAATRRDSPRSEDAPS